ncbi:E3 ubiquitin-protein ligase complex slx8-rfp subunit rfp2 [Drosophila hydei]|uniref:E3 ubiquitin-protein ligase complex slx8-rfp subunit rfp2 n=1 Tax=Drosophila hydei TaxID=7224 RepID=A0A6J1LTZ0_DROHY|nr:E3 ubiquitin-protein ligase complex slx8-rfp subunit rfp2 [Drosophila hydei]
MSSMSSVTDISLSESLTPPTSTAHSVVSSPIFELMENSSPENTFESNLTSENSSSSYSLRPSHFEQRSGDTLDLTNDGWQDSLEESFRHDLIEAEIASIRLFCEEVDNNLTQIGLGPVGSNSTPRNLYARRNNRESGGNQPEDVIDLSSLDLYPPRHFERPRTPEAFIDLCTPEPTRRLPAFINLTDSTNEPTAANRRRLYENNQSTAAAESIDLGFSLPKRECLDEHDSSSESYKCPVCLECVRKREPSSTKCGHIFCKSCIETAIASTHKCPLCNKRVAKRSIFRIYL